MSARLPLFPLGTVLFPGLVLPLHVFEERYRALTRDLMAIPGDPPREFGVVALRQGWEVAQPGAAGDGGVSLYEIGCSAELRQVTELPDGGFNLVTVGRRRFRIEELVDAGTPYQTARVQWLPEPDDADGQADRLAPRVLAVFRQYLALIRPGEAEEISEQLPDDPTVLSHLVAATAALTLPERQRLLAVTGTAARLRAELRLLNRETALLRQVRAVPVPLAELGVTSSPN